MLFNSFNFIFIFLPVVLIGYFVFPSLSSLWILASSVFFYGMFGINFLPVLIVSICVNYFVSRRIESGNAKKLWLISGIAFNFIMLSYFKFFAILPPGISFFTFTQTAYLVCIFKGSARSESIMNYSEYVSFFPYVISGPISDYRDIMPQLKSESIRRFNDDNLAAGITLFILGLFKKAYIADNIAPIVNNFFANPDTLNFSDAWFAALSYSAQLYFDFSGYSDMAIALALMMNIKLPMNFDSPYKSLSIIDFWRRWHMTLGKWIRDYIYIPLGGSREGDLKRMRNVIIAMLFTGIWHGVGFTFVIWGLIHGLMLAVNHQWRRLNVKIPALISWFITFFCVVLCWIVFRADSLNDAIKIWKAMFDFKNANLLHIPTDTKTALSYYLAMAAMISALLFPNSNRIISRFKPGFIYAVLVLVLAITSLINFSGVSDFLYFKF